MSWTIKSADQAQGALEIVLAQLDRLNGKGYKIIEPERLSATVQELSDSIVLGGLTADMLDFLATRGVISLEDPNEANAALETLLGGA